MCFIFIFISLFLFYVFIHEGKHKYVRRSGSSLQLWAYFQDVLVLSLKIQLRCLGCCERASKEAALTKRVTFTSVTSIQSVQLNIPCSLILFPPILTHTQPVGTAGINLLITCNDPLSIQH